MKMYCITIFDDHYQKIKNLEYIPVGLGENITLNNFVTDKTGINISKKILIMVNILFIIGYAKIKKLKKKTTGLVSVNIENFG